MNDRVRLNLGNAGGGLLCVRKVRFEETRARSKKVFYSRTLQAGIVVVIEIIENSNFVSTRLKRSSDMRADKSCPTRDEDSHEISNERLCERRHA